MRKTDIVAFLLAFIFTGACSADEINGKVTSVDSSKNTLQISGVIIQTSGAWIENEQDYPLAMDKLMPGDYIEVEGRFTGLSEMTARKIDRKQPECGVVAGKITLVDFKKREIIINGITIKVPADTWLEGPSRVKIPLELFTAGYSVQCKGKWTGSSELTAFKVTVD